MRGDIENPKLWQEACRLADIFCFHQMGNANGCKPDSAPDVAPGVYEALRLGRITSEVFTAKVLARERRDRTERFFRFKDREIDGPARRREQENARQEARRLARVSTPDDSLRAAEAKTIRSGGAAPPGGNSPE